MRPPPNEGEQSVAAPERATSPVVGNGHPWPCPWRVRRVHTPGCDSRRGLTLRPSGLSENGPGEASTAHSPLPVHLHTSPRPRPRMSFSMSSRPRRTSGTCNRPGGRSDAPVIDTYWRSVMARRSAVGQRTRFGSGMSEVRVLPPRLAAGARGGHGGSTWSWSVTPERINLRTGCDRERGCGACAVSRRRAPVPGLYAASLRSPRKGQVNGVRASRRSSNGGAAVF